VPNRSHHSGRANRGARVRGLNTWTSILALEVALVAGSNTQFDVVNDTDWVPSSGTAKATLLRIRGWLNMVSKVGSGSFAGGALFAYIGVFDEDTASPAANLVSTYVDEDILWTGGVQFPFLDSGAADAYRLDVDVKAQRKIRNGEEVRLVVTNNLVVPVDISFLLRGLLRRGS